MSYRIINGYIAFVVIAMISLLSVCGCQNTAHGKESNHNAVTQKSSDTDTSAKRVEEGVSSASASVSENSQAVLESARQGMAATTQNGVMPDINLFQIFQNIYNRATKLASTGALLETIKADVIQLRTDLNNERTAREKEKQFYVDDGIKKDKKIADLENKTQKDLATIRWIVFVFGAIAVGLCASWGKIKLAIGFTIGTVAVMILLWILGWVDKHMWLIFWSAIGMLIAYVLTETMIRWLYTNPRNLATLWASFVKAITTSPQQDIADLQGSSATK